MRIKPKGVTRKLATKLGGYDIFISYRHLDAEVYAENLHEVLEKKGLIVFRDESEKDNSGTSIDEFVKLACSARCLVMIVTAGVYESENVYDELSGYLANRIDKWYRRPFSRIISINVDQALSSASSRKPNWGRLSNFVYEPDTLAALLEGVPDPKVIKKLSAAGSFMNTWRRFLITMLLSVALIILVGAATLVYQSSLRNEISFKANRLSAISDSTRRLSASNQFLTHKNKSIQNNSLKLMKTNFSLHHTADSISRQVELLQSRSDNLKDTEKMMDLRIEAMNQITHEPLIAFRLAQQAYTMSPDYENRKLIMGALSKIDLYFKSAFAGYTVEDIKEPFVLLTKDSGSGNKEFFMLNLTNLHLAAIPISAEKAWIILVDHSWRLFAQTFEGRAGSKMPLFQLWNDRNEAISEKVQAHFLTRVQFFDQKKVSIYLNKEDSTLIWDLASGQKNYIKHETDNYPATDDLGLYQPLAIRNDGYWAAKYNNELVLVNKSGKLVKNTDTNVSFDRSETGGQWSDDEKYLALATNGENELGIWDPTKRYFKWLSHDGWITDSYTWSKGDHLLAYSGNTINALDFTIKVIDVDFPAQIKTIDYNGKAPIKSMIFLSGNKDLAICDYDGNICVIDIATGSITRKAYQKGVEKLYRIRNTFISSSANDVRIWEAKKSPAEFWSFQSMKNRHYIGAGAADPLDKWLAVPFIDKEVTSGIEIRNIQTGETRNLYSFNKGADDIEFSTDGRWLILETGDTGRIWNTKSWQLFNFPLLENDRQFFNLKIKGDTLNAHVLGKNREYNYSIGLNKLSPFLINRVYFKNKNEVPYRIRGLEVAKEIKGWESDNLYKFQNAELSSTPNSHWAVSARCKDSPFLSEDCDVQFIPINITKLVELFDNLLWKPIEKKQGPEAVIKMNRRLKIKILSSKLPK